MNSGIWHESFKPGLYPSVIFIDSPRNEGLINYNERVVAKLVQHNISAVQYVTTKQPVTIGYFMNASMNPHESKLLQHFLFREQFIMPMDRVLVKDPSIERNRIELTQIVTLLAPRLVPGKDSMSGVPGQSAIMQLLRLSFGHKEVNAEYVDQMVSWFNTHR